MKSYFAITKKKALFVLKEDEFSQHWSEFIAWSNSKGITVKDCYAASMKGREAILALLQKHKVSPYEYEEKLISTGIIQQGEEREQRLYRDNPSLEAILQTYFNLSNVSLREDILIDWNPTLSDVNFAIQASMWCGTLEHEMIHWKRRHAGYRCDIPFASAYYAVVRTAWLEYFVPRDKWPNDWVQCLSTVSVNLTVQEVIVEIQVLIERYKKANQQEEEPPNSYLDGNKLGICIFYALDANIFKASVFLEVLSYAGSSDASTIMEYALGCVKSVSDDPNTYIPQFLTGWFGAHRTRDNAFWAYANEVLKGLSIASSITSYLQNMLEGCNTNKKAPMFGDSMYWQLDHALFYYLFRKYRQLPLREIATVPEVMPFLERQYPQEFLSWTEERERIIKRFLVANGYTKGYAS